MEDWKGGRRKAPAGRQVEEWKGEGEKTGWGEVWKDG